ncbi:MAG: ATP-binding protein, partial [Butyrivibrio sp.]|nr:ATP-binding protein [Butyrivibrio sp.]
ADVDSQLFKRVISNLLANANKYNTSGNTVGIDVSHENGAITIEVADDGEAIAKDFVPKMFDAFSRGDTTRKTDGGTGLGLAIAKKIAIKHKAVLSYDRTKDRNLFVFKLKEALA